VEDTGPPQLLRLLQTADLGPAPTDPEPDPA
jgi:hypothetical protein